MKIPDVIEILHIPYKIKECGELMPSSGEFGCIDYQMQEIKLNKNVKKEQKYTTLIHEILHGVYFACGIDSGTEITVNEQHVDLMANVLTPVITQLLEAHNERSSRTTTRGNERKKPRALQTGKNATRRKSRDKRRGQDV